MISLFSLKTVVVLYHRIEDKKQLYKGFLADMSDCVAEIKSVTLRKKPGDTMATVARVGSQYNKLRVDLLRGKWILKVRKESV